MAHSFRYWFTYFLKQHGFKRTLVGIFCYFYWQLKKPLYDFSKENIINVNGCQLSLIPNDSGISQELLVFKTHEPFSTKVLSNYLHEGMVCIDVGGNLGYYAALESKKVGSTGRIIVIEPSPLNFRYLTKNLALQNQNNYELYNYACGNKDGEVRFLISEHSNTSRVLKDDEKTLPDMSIIKVPIIILDDFLKKKRIDRVDILRMDVEGYEDEVLEGAKELIRNFQPNIQIEVHYEELGPQNTKKVLGGFRNMGYQKINFIPRELDFALVGNKNDMKKTTIDQLIVKLENNLLPRGFILFLEKPQN